MSTRPPVPSRSEKPSETQRPSLRRSARLLLFLAFAFTVMADPISSVAYAIEAALRALGGNLTLLVPTMALVVVVIAVVTLNYHQLVARFPDGGGSAAAAGAAFGEAWAFLPIGALVVDFVLTIAISVAAGASAIVAYVPWLASHRVLVALTLLVLVAVVTWFGHGGRTVFAVLTFSFLGLAVVLLFRGILPIGHAVMGGLAPLPRPTTVQGWGSALAVALAFPVAMALATGVEAPSSAIAQLGQLDARGRQQFGQATLWLTLVLVGGLTVGLAALAVHLGVGIPAQNSTQMAELARAAGSPALFAGFQLTTTLLLLSAASSSFQAGPGLLKALARQAGRESQGILPTWMGRINRHYTPYWGVVLYLLIAAVVVIAVNAQDQELVLFYAVAVFVSFLMGLLAMVQFSRVEHRPLSLAVNLLGTLVVGFTLVMNLLRGWPLFSLMVACAVAFVLFGLWVHAGRPRGIALAVQKAEVVDAGQPVSGQDEVKQHQAARRDERPCGQYEQEEFP